MTFVHRNGLFNHELVINSNKFLKYISFAKLE